MPPTNLVRLFTGPRLPKPAITNIVYTWDAYTNAYYIWESSTNLTGTNWSFYTNVPITASSLCVPVTQPQQFFRIKTVIVDNLTTN